MHDHSSLEKTRSPEGLGLPLDPPRNWNNLDPLATVIGVQAYTRLSMSWMQSHQQALAIEEYRSLREESAQARQAQQSVLQWSIAAFALMFAAGIFFPSGDPGKPDPSQSRLEHLPAGAGSPRRPGGRPDSTAPKRGATRGRTRCTLGPVNLEREGGAYDGSCQARRSSAAGARLSPRPLAPTPSPDARVAERASPRPLRTAVARPAALV